ncbi:MAG: hypothetical protein IBX55_20785 [Methyloprofundus sp.]|nr:hypothetical protein [Methyloprofundus sp.]
MRLDNLIKGQVTQSMVKSILESAGYRVSRLGVEEIFTEVTHLDYKQYEELNLPIELRSLPDLLVATATIDKAWLVEVKYRAKFDEDTIKEIYNTLSTQFAKWPDTVVVLLIGSHPRAEKPGRFIQDYMRIITKQSLNELIKPRDMFRMPDFLLANGFKAYESYWIWEDLEKPQVFFKRLEAKSVLAKADAFIRTLKSLTKR